MKETATLAPRPPTSAIERLIVGAQRLRMHQQFRVNLGYFGNFDEPKTYQEKVQFRKLHGNHEFYALLADKYRVRQYVADKAGAQYLVPLLGVYDRLQPAHFDPLPNQFMIKANHGCKWNQAVLDKRKLDIDATVRRFNRHLRQRYGWRGCERHYNFIAPKIVIEELLRDSRGAAPWDYNFFCYNGPDGFDYDYTIESPRESGAGAALARDGTVLFIDKITREEAEAHAKPENFEGMVTVAKQLSEGFDFVRVDLYVVEGKVYFGELTCTPRRGYGKIAEEEIQRMRTEKWHLDAGNPTLYRPRRNRRPVVT